MWVYHKEYPTRWCRVRLLRLTQFIWYTIQNAAIPCSVWWFLRKGMKGRSLCSTFPTFCSEINKPTWSVVPRTSCCRALMDGHVASQKVPWWAAGNSLRGSLPRHLIQKAIHDITWKQYKTDTHSHWNILVYKPKGGSVMDLFICQLDSSSKETLDEVIFSSEFNGPENKIK